MAASKKKPQRLFLAVYLGTARSMKKYERLPAKTRAEREKQGMADWGEWVKKNRKQIVDVGSPLGSTKQADRKGIRVVTNDLCAYTVVRAESHAAAAKLFKDHPHFTLFPGESVQILECLEIPGING